MLRFSRVACVPQKTLARSGTSYRNPMSLRPRSFAFAVALVIACMATREAVAQESFAARADTLLDYLNSNTPNVGQTGGGPNRIGRTGFWYGQGRIARGDTATGLGYISAAVGDADAEVANGGFSLWPGMDAWYRHNAIFSQELKDKYRDEYVGARYYFGATPNQRLMGATAAYLASEIWGVGPVTSVSNASNGTGDPSGKAFLDQILTVLPRYNSEEHNAAQYLTFNLGPFHTLANFAPDPLLRQKARMGFDWLVADTAPSWLNGYACISNTRGRVDAPQNTYNGTTHLGWWLKFGGPPPAHGRPGAGGGWGGAGGGLRPRGGGGGGGGARGGGGGGGGLPGDRGRHGPLHVTLDEDRGGDRRGDFRDV